MSETLYELRDVRKRFGSGDIGVWALDGLDLEIDRGEMVVVAGPSGSGKSTLLQLLGALDRPTAGEVRFEGHDVAALGERRLAELRLSEIGFVFQQFNLIPTLTAAENVEAALAPAGIAGSTRAARVNSLLERVGLAARRDHLPSQLSGGEQQRVAIARALANEPGVLLADEPTGNLDAANGQAVLDLLRTLWLEEGLTLILVTHDAGIAGSAPRVVRLADGRIEGAVREELSLAAGGDGR